jgi:hypothetical protein
MTSTALFGNIPPLDGRIACRDPCPQAEMSEPPGSSHVTAYK